LQLGSLSRDLEVLRSWFYGEDQSVLKSQVRF
jgi:hypothetical protein